MVACLGEVIAFAMCCFSTAQIWEIRKPKGKINDSLPLCPEHQSQITHNFTHNCQLTNNPNIACQNTGRGNSQSVGAPFKFWHARDELRQHVLFPVCGYLYVTERFPQYSIFQFT